MSIHDPLRVCALDTPHRLKDVEGLLKLSPDYVDQATRRALAEVGPPSNNMGGKLALPPCFLPHGEKQEDSVVAQATKIDWLSFTSPKPIEALRMAVQVLFPTATFHYTNKGMYGYPKSDFITVDGEQIGILGYDASHGRSLVSITGSGCSKWDAEMIQIAYETCQVVEARLKRVDVCLDFYNGERTWDHAVHCYERGDFKRREGGGQPYVKKFDQSQDGKNLGRTLYVNKPKSAVMARIYEKGLEVFEKLPSVYKTVSEAREVEYVDNGGVVPFADTWLRVEIEFNCQDKDRPIPLEILTDRDNYFAGSFPYCANVLPLATPVRPKNLMTDKEVSLVKLLAACRTSYGSLVHTLQSVGVKDAEIIELLTNGKVNKRLQQSGMLSAMEKGVSDWKLKNPDSDIPF